MTNSHSPSSADSTYEQLAEARIARQGRMLGRLRKAINAFVDIGLARDHDQSAPDMIEAVDLAITPTHVREAREAHQNLDTDLAPSAAAASLTERLIQAAVDYESGRCSRKELSQARAAAEAAITGALAQGCVESVSLTELARRHAATWGDHSASSVSMLAAFGKWLLAAQPPAAPVETERRCQKCGETTKGEEALVDGQIWCHPCADAAPLSRSSAGKATAPWVCCRCDAPLTCAACGFEQPNDSEHYQKLQDENDRLRAVPQGACICQDQHRRGYCTEPGCPYSLTRPLSKCDGSDK